MDDTTSQFNPQQYDANGDRVDEGQNNQEAPIENKMSLKQLSEHEPSVDMSAPVVSHEPVQEAQAPVSAAPAGEASAPSEPAEVQNHQEVAAPISFEPEKPAEPERKILDQGEFKKEIEENDGSLFSVPPVKKEEKPKDVPHKNNFILPTKKMLIVLVVALTSVLAIFAYTKLRPAGQNSHVLGATTETKETSMIEKVAQIVAIPNQEQPSQIANISNIKKFSNNPFFINGQNGDVLIIYEKSKEAVLYRPSTNQVVAIGPFSNDIDNSTVSASPTASPSPSLSPTVTP
ncbi:MAG TPA: hypothetical protein VG917_01510 [Patescibacteria group bacterium]|nr:hypothetical protein [Patescibacteria group bacterium]